MNLTIHGFKDDIISPLVQKAPSFSIKSLLDKIPGQNFQTDEFMSNTILSKYYTIGELISAKFADKLFSVYHLNIASLQKHIHELRIMLSCVQIKFDIICISETKLKDEMSLSNIQIEGYEFIHTPTLTQCGGVGMYIKIGIEYGIINNLTQSHENICESIFVELKHPSKKNVIIGSI